MTIYNLIFFIELIYFVLFIFMKKNTVEQIQKGIKQKITECQIIA